MFALNAQERNRVLNLQEKPNRKKTPRKTEKLPQREKKHKNTTDTQTQKDDGAVCPSSTTETRNQSNRRGMETNLNPRQQKAHVIHSIQVCPDVSRCRLPPGDPLTQQVNLKLTVLLQLGYESRTV